jgi:hypothetical protein
LRSEHAEHEMEYTPSVSAVERLLEWAPENIGEIEVDGVRFRGVNMEGKQALQSRLCIFNHDAHANTYPSQSDNSHLPPIRPDISAHLHIPDHLRRIRRSPFHNLSSPNPVTKRAPAGLPNRPITPAPGNILHAKSPTPENHRLRTEAHYLRKLRKH